MAEDRIKLKKKEMIAKDTMAFYWETPDDFDFKAGQLTHIKLINPEETDDEGNKRAFSLAYAPSEHEIVTATRLRDSAFKRVLRNLSEGDEVEYDGASGSFTLHKTESTPAVFLIGGIGITAVRSMIAEATNQETDHEITLLYSNKTPEDAPFLDDLRKFEEQNPNFNFVPIMTRSDEDEWDGERGHIDENLLKRYVKDIDAPIYYTCGPGKMIEAMQDMLVNAGVNEDNIRAEEFAGY
jgi:ferredoxin-NADP reductase